MCEGIRIKGADLCDIKIRQIKLCPAPFVGPPKPIPRIEKVRRIASAVWWKFRCCCEYVFAVVVVIVFGLAVGGFVARGLCLLFGG